MLSAKKIPAGKSGRIEVKIQTDGFAGHILKRIVIMTNDPGHPNIELSIRAIVEPEVETSDSSIFFEEVPAGKESVREIILKIPETKQIKIVSAVSKDRNVSVRLEPIQESNGKKVRLIATRKANAKPGYHFGQIIIRTDSRRTPEITIYERGVVTTPEK